MWYYAEGATRHGPLEASSIDALILEGKVTADTLVWREGLTGWEAASDHFDMSRQAPPSPSSAPPPPPPPALQSGAAPHVAPAPAAAPAQGASSGDLGEDGLYVGAPGREFAEAIKVCFSKFVTFSGRASRSEFWWWVLFVMIVGLLTSIIDTVAFPALIDVSPLNSLSSLILFLPGLAVSVRRLHDIDRTGWWIGGFYLGFGVFAGVILALVAGSADPAAAFDPSSGIIMLVPLIGLAAIIYLIVFIVFACTRGTLGPNRFG